jgi:hypothetical protein
MPKTRAAVLEKFAELANMTSCRGTLPCTDLPRIAYLDGGVNHAAWNDFTLMYPRDSPRQAMFDPPVGSFVWDLLDAYPNSRVALSVRPVSENVVILLKFRMRESSVLRDFQPDRWYGSFEGLHSQAALESESDNVRGRSTFTADPTTLVTFGVDTFPSPRQALRR